MKKTYLLVIEMPDTGFPDWYRKHAVAIGAVAAGMSFTLACVTAPKLAISETAVHADVGDPVTELVDGTVRYPTHENPYYETVSSYQWCETTHARAVREANDALTAIKAVRDADAADATDAAVALLDAKVEAVNAAIVDGHATVIDPAVQEAKDASGALHANAEAQREAARKAAEEAARKAAEEAARKAAEEKAAREAAEKAAAEKAAAEKAAQSAKGSSGSSGSSSGSSTNKPSGSGSGSSGSSTNKPSGSGSGSSNSGSQADTWTLSYTAWDGNSQAHYQRLVDQGGLVRCMNWNYFCAHNYTSAGKRIKSCPAYVVCDGVRYKFAGTWTQSKGDINSVCDRYDSYNGGSGLVFQTCNGDGLMFLARYVRC